MSRRIALATLFALLLVPLAAGPASAGGSVFDFDDAEGHPVPNDGFVLPGDVLTAHTTFSPQISGLGGIEDGPWIAYLLPGGRYVSPGHIQASAISLGQLEILKREFDTLARITFTMPSVRTGGYTMSLCNDPCTENGLGDITGGWLRIAQTTKEGRLTARLEDVRRDRSRVKHELAVSQERRGELRAALEHANDTALVLQSRIDELEARLRATRKAAAAADRLLIDDGPALAIAAAIALLAIVVALALRRSRRSTIGATPERLRAGNGTTELSRPRAPRSREPVGPRR